MKTAIVYCTTHGTTEMIAMKIAGNFPGATLWNLKTSSLADLSAYDTIIIGGSVHAGMVQKRLRDFCHKHLLDLLDKNVVLYLCGMNKPQYKEQASRAFPEILLEHAGDCHFPGGEFRMEKMNFFQRLIVKKISGVSESVSEINDDAIDVLVQKAKGLMVA